MSTGLKANADGSAAIQVGGSDAITISTAGVIGFNSGYGSVATAYGCRAWVNFNGTGTVAIRASGNVSSITDGGVGVYTVNFTNAMPDVNYAVTGICHSPGTTNGALQAPGGSAGNQLVGSVQVNAITGSMSATFDASYMFVVIHR